MEERYMKYYEVQWHPKFDRDVMDTEEYVSRRDLCKAYIPSELTGHDLDGVELAFERLTGIDKRCIVLYDMEPYYVVDQDLEFVDTNDMEESNE